MNKSPRWHTLNIPIAKPREYILSGSAALLDDVGLIWSAGADQRKYEIRDPITGYGSVAQGVWTELNGFEYDFSITKKDNKVSVTLQTLAHLDKTLVGNNLLPLLTFGIGIFIDAKLAAVKVYEVAAAAGSSGTFMIATMMTHLENLPVGDHTLKVALIPRLFKNYNNKSMTVGRPNPGGDNISQFMANSSMKIDVFVKSDDN